ncbi:type II secretory pathway pseudopilin PulG [Desulfitispora alkaliphila]|uniref:type IV pilus modification PilV family protein n=1 Tax=Desulfitispora alkaliphila TaxID=622674 RepID=UPI003D1A749B
MREEGYTFLEVLASVTILLLLIQVLFYPLDYITRTDENAKKSQALYIAQEQIEMLRAEYHRSEYILGANAMHNSDFLWGEEDELRWEGQWELVKSGVSTGVYKYKVIVIDKETDKKLLSLETKFVGGSIND